MMLNMSSFSSLNEAIIAVGGVRQLQIQTDDKLYSINDIKCLMENCTITLNSSEGYCDVFTNAVM